MAEKVRGWDPSLWASRKPFGIGEQRPNNFFEIGRAVAENRDELAYALRILREGVCDGCALGTTGLRDWTMEGVHLCNIRLRLLRLNTMGALSPEALAHADGLRGLDGKALRDLGRLPYPMRRRHSEPGFTRIGWDEALDAIADGIREAGPERVGFYLTSRGMTNESYYAAQKAARAMGTNSIDNAARVCHSPSTFGLKEALGVGATTCSYRDWLHADLIVFCGSNIANNQPVATKYLYHARRSGTKVACVNTYREPGMERYWIPSVPESALFGTKLTDRFFLLDTGGDLAFLTGVLKAVIDHGWWDDEFVQAHTTGWGELRDVVEAADWAQLEAGSGSTREEMTGLARMIAEADRAVFVWSMGLTQHAHGENNVRAIINLALTKGFVGRDGCGLMPIRGHSGVQGGAEMGAYATAFPGGVPITTESAADLSRQWGFEVPAERGLTAPQMIDAAAAGDLDVLVAAGGNFADVLPDPEAVRHTLARIPLRVHLDIVLSSQMLVDPEPGCEVLLLPAATRYETPGGLTETSTERRIIFSPEVRGRRIGEARPEWEVFGDLAARVRPELAERVRFADTPAIRREIAQVVPFYAGIERLREAGDQVQYGGPHLCAGWDFPTADGKAHFAAVRPGPARSRAGRFALATRRGKQFNSIVHEGVDAITGARRDAVLMHPDDAGALGLRNGAQVVVRSDSGELRGHVLHAPVAPGNVQVHWPEGNVLIPQGRRSAEADIPDYNALVTVEPAS